MRDALVPGVTDNQLWGLFNSVNIAHGGGWCDGRILCSDPRTNPWLQEATSRVVESGDRLAFDTDLLGPLGFCADVSRTWLCGDDSPDYEVRRLYAAAYTELH